MDLTTLATQEPDPTQVSVYSLMGPSIPQTLRVIGKIKQIIVFILMDNGSTHSFLQDRVAKQLGLTTEITFLFKVLIGNGKEF